jgi:hypothetical protein
MPYQENVPPDNLFTPDASALQLLRVIDGVSAKDTGGFFAWDGQTIPY